MALDSLLHLLALSNGDIIDFKRNKKRLNLIKMSKDLYFKLKIKFALYFIISFLLLLFFWYYISMFGAIYRNIQYHLLKDILLSFVISMITSFGFYFLPGILRIISLSDSHKNRKCLYNFSNILLLL